MKKGKTLYFVLFVAFLSLLVLISCSTKKAQDEVVDQKTKEEIAEEIIGKPGKIMTNEIYFVDRWEWIKIANFPQVKDYKYYSFGQTSGIEFGGKLKIKTKKDNKILVQYSHPDCPRGGGTATPSGTLFWIPIVEWNLWVKGYHKMQTGAKLHAEIKNNWSTKKDSALYWFKLADTPEYEEKYHLFNKSQPYYKKSQKILKMWKETKL